MANLVLFNKPFGVISQFSPSGEKTTLADFIDIKGIYPAGRLDYDSEGLLLLTDDGVLQNRICDPHQKLAKTYWVQVEGVIDQNALTKLERGVILKDGMTAPAKAKLITPPIWERVPPIRNRKSIPTSWLELIITEGRNRQVRRMTAAVGYPTLRLVRYRIGQWNLDDINPGEYHLETIHTPIKQRVNTNPKNRSTKNRKR